MWKPCSDPMALEDAASQGRSQGSMAGAQTAPPCLTRAPPFLVQDNPSQNTQAVPHSARAEGLSLGFHSCADHSRVLGPAWVPASLDQPCPSDLILPSSGSLS